MTHLNFPEGYSLGYGQTIFKGHPGFKNPLLVLGCHAYARLHTIPNNLKEFDTHILFFPTSEQYFQIGIVYIGRGHNNVSVDWGYGPHAEEVLKHLYQQFRPVTFPNEVNILQPKQIVWLTHSIYRLPKISLNDILNLESYKLTAS